MSIFPVLYTIGFLSFLYFGLYVFTQKKRDRKSQLFLAFCLCFSFWNLAYAALTVSREPYHIFFQKLGYLCAGLYSPFYLLFMLEMIGIRKRPAWKCPSRIILLSAIFAFPAVLSWHNLVYNAVAEDFPTGFWYLAHQIYANFYNAVSILLMFLWRFRTGSNREKRQATLLISGAIFTIILTLITDFIMGAAGRPTLTPFLTLIWGGCIFYSFSELNFMKTSPLFISSAILTQSPDITILFDRNLRMLYSNRNLDRQENDIHMFFENFSRFSDKIADMTSLNLKSFSLPVVLRVGPGIKQQLQGRFSLITDDYDGLGGILFSGREKQSAADEAETWKLSPREIEVLELLLNGKSNSDITGILGITERTVKSHVSSMLHKTDTKSRLELVQLFRPEA